jgi:FkbM family methyltransferase
MFKKTAWKEAKVSDAEPCVRPFPSAATEEDVYYCFRLLLNRNPGEKEWSGHRTTAGTDLQEIVSKFLHSNEFKSRRLVTSSLNGTMHEIIETMEGFRICISKEDMVCGGLRGSGEYEPAVTSVVKRVLREGMTFVDIGANIGYFTLLASAIVRDGGKVFAVEPYHYNLKLLCINLQLNAVQNVEILPFALADRKGFLNYDNSAGNSGNVFKIGLTIESMLDSVLVYAVRLDNELVSDKPVDLIKMDIEGAEYLAVQGMQQLIERDKPIIISEFSADFLQSVSNASPQEYLSLLLQDETYQLAVIRGVDQLEFCGRDTEKLIGLFSQGESMCMDIVAYPIARHALLFQ